MTIYSRTLVFLIVTSPLLFQLGDNNDASQIQGTWKIVKVKSNGKFIAEGIANKGRYFFIKDKWMDVSAMKIIHENRFVLFPEKTPKEIDIKISETESLVGLYSLKGDELTLCISLMGQNRPKTFDAPIDSKQTLVILEREK